MGGFYMPGTYYPGGSENNTGLPNPTPVPWPGYDPTFDPRVWDPNWLPPGTVSPFVGTDPGTGVPQSDPNLWDELTRILRGLGITGSIYGSDGRPLYDPSGNPINRDGANAGQPVEAPTATQPQQPAETGSTGTTTTTTGESVPDPDITSVDVTAPGSWIDPAILWGGLGAGLGLGLGGVFGPSATPTAPPPSQPPLEVPDSGTPTFNTEGTATPDPPNIPVAQPPMTMDPWSVVNLPPPPGVIQPLPPITMPQVGTIYAEGTATPPGTGTPGTAPPTGTSVDVVDVMPPGPQPIPSPITGSPIPGPVPGIEVPPGTGATVTYPKPSPQIPQIPTGGGVGPMPGSPAPVVGSGPIQSMFPMQYPPSPQVLPLAYYMRGFR